LTNNRNSVKSGWAFVLQEKRGGVATSSFFYIFETKTPMDNLIIKRSQIIEAQITGTPATNKRYFFTDIPQLSRLNIVIYGLEAFTSTQLANSPQSASAVVGTSTGISVTLRDLTKTEFAYQIPYYTLIRANNSGLVVLFTPKTINLTDCYVQLSNTTGINSNDVACFNLYYDFV
jgi:hypothetical protein